MVLEDHVEIQYVKMTSIHPMVKILELMTFIGNTYTQISITQVLTTMKQTNNVLFYTEIIWTSLFISFSRYSNMLSERDAFVFVVWRITNYMFESTNPSFQIFEPHCVNV